MIDTGENAANPGPAGREEIEMLLPWYGTDRLDPIERQRVEDYLARHPDMLAQLELIEEERFQATLANEALPAPNANAIDKLLDSVAASDRPARPVSAGSLLGHITASLRGFFNAPTSGAVKWATALAVVLIAFQALTIATLVIDRAGQQNYQTASGGATGGAEGTFALVRFRDAATAAEIATALEATDTKIVDGPKPGGLYRIRIGGTKLNEAERDRRITDLRAKSNVILLVIPSD